MNSIPQLQNEKKELERLAAAHQLYSKAKSWLFWQLMLVIVAAVCLAFLLADYPGVQAWASIVVVFIMFLDSFVLEPRQRDFARQAVKMQEAFDCEVLGLRWPYIKMNGLPDPEEVHAYSLKYQGMDPGFASLRNRYVASVGQVPIAVARIICQRANIWWDSELCSRYDRYIFGFVALLWFVVLVVSCTMGTTIEAVLFAALAPILPASQWGIREYLKQQEAVENLRRLLRVSATLFEQTCKKMLSDDQLTQSARALQSEIYDHRQTAPLVFDWVYTLIRKEMEGRMIQIGDLLVKEYLEKGDHT